MKKKVWQKEFETVIELYLEICINTKNHKSAKDGLHQYRSICQTTNPQSLEHVVRSYLEKAMARAKEAFEESDRIMKENDEKSEQESLESLIVRSVSGETIKERLERLYVSPWVKFIWETFRAILELVRNKSRLEQLYQETALLAINYFSVQYQRKNEIKRLSDLFRNHLRSPSPTNPQNYVINFHSLETSHQCLLEIRFALLNAAVKYELWQDAFKTADDISSIIQLTKKQPPPHLMASYYEKLAQLFWVSGDYLFHAHARLKFYVLSKNQNKSLTPEELETLASNVLLAAIAVPLTSTEQANDPYFEFNQKKEKYQHFASLLSLPPSSPLRRENIISEIKLRMVPTSVVPELQNLFYFIEEKFHPLQLSKTLAPKLEFVKQHPFLQQYSPLVEKVIFSKLLLQLSKVYKTMKLDHLRSLSSVIPQENIEILIVKAVKDNIVDIRIDYQHKVIHFGKESLGSEQIRNQLTLLSSKLQGAVALINPQSVVQKKILDKKNFFVQSLQNAQEEHRQNMSRIQRIEEKKEAAETIEKLKNKISSMQIQIEIAKAPKEEPVENVSEAKPQELLPIIPPVQAAAQKIDPTKAKKVKDLQAKLSKLSEQVDFLERARREEEGKLLEEWYKDYIKRESSFFEESSQKELERHKKAYDIKLAEKKRLAKMKDDKDNLIVTITQRQEAAHQAQIAEIRKKNDEIKQKIEEAKEEARKRIIQQRIEAKKEEIRREEEERNRRELQEQRRRDEEERIRKQNEQLEKQMKIDEEIEKRRREREREKAPVQESAWGRNRGDNQRDNLRDRGDNTRKEESRWGRGGDNRGDNRDSQRDVQRDAPRDNRDNRGDNQESRWGRGGDNRDNRDSQRDVPRDNRDNRGDNQESRWGRGGDNRDNRDSQRDVQRDAPRDNRGDNQESRWGRGGDSRGDNKDNRDSQRDSDSKWGRGSDSQRDRDNNRGAPRGSSQWGKGPAPSPSRNNNNNNDNNDDDKWHIVGAKRRGQ